MNQMMVTNSDIVTDSTNRENFLQKGSKKKKPIRRIGWHEWDDATSALAHELISRHVDPDFIYSIPRGGLLLGVQMSHALSAPLVVDHPSTWGSGLRNNGITGQHRFEGDGHRQPKVLVLDSIVDTGRTIRRLRAKGWLSPYDVHYATVYCDLKQKSLVDTHQVGKHTDQWLEFPWESIATTMAGHPYRMGNLYPPKERAKQTMVLKGALDKKRKK
jgi:hypoxanthine phosphoribosyltransferase